VKHSIVRVGQVHEARGQDAQGDARIRKPAYVRAFVRFVDRVRQSMIPGVAYRFTIPPLPADEAAAT